MHFFMLFSCVLCVVMQTDLAAEPQLQLYPVCRHKKSCSKFPLGEEKRSGCFFGGPPYSSLHTINSTLTAPWESMEDVDSSAECCLRRNRIHLGVGWAAESQCSCALAVLWDAMVLLMPSLFKARQGISAIHSGDGKSEPTASIGVISFIDKLNQLALRTAMEKMTHLFSAEAKAECWTFPSSHQFLSPTPVLS